MRVKTVQIVWHSKEPVYSLDFHSSGLLASGGADKDVKVGQFCQTRLNNSRNQSTIVV
jgi:hypothetical protein